MGVSLFILPSTQSSRPANNTVDQCGANVPSAGQKTFSSAAPPPRPLSIQSIQMKKRDKNTWQEGKKMIWRGGNQFGLKNNALLELDGD
jgi:hypothetical protein